MVMTQRCSLRRELDVAARLAATMTDERTAREVERYRRELESRLLYDGRPPTDIII